MNIAAPKKHLWTLAVFLSVPLILMAGSALSVAINPESLAGHAGYVRDFRLLQLARSAIMAGMFGAVVVGWFLTSLLVVRFKDRSYAWLPLALLGPPGLAALAALRDLSAEPPDLYERLMRKLNRWLRAVYEVAFFVLGWMAAWEMMIAQREVMIWIESLTTGASRNQILDQQNASSGMWAFGELTEVFYYFVLLYLLRPVLVDIAGALFRSAARPTLGASTSGS